MLVTVSDHHLLCCWTTRQGWSWQSVPLPEGSCRDGIPLQREVISELLADLLFDQDVVPGQVELLLPLAGVHWRVLVGVRPEEVPALEASAGYLHELDWPLEPIDTYCTFACLGDAVMAIGVSRTTLQAWIDVVELADLPLHRVNWSLSSACQGLNNALDAWSDDLALLLPHGQMMRMVLIRDGVPEVDRRFKLEQPDQLRDDIRRFVAAWRAESSVNRSLGWWFSLPDLDAEGLLPLIDLDRGEQRLDQALAWTPDSVMDGSGQRTLDPLDHLCLYGMVSEDER